MLHYPAPKYDEIAPFHSLPGRLDAGILLVCDHASAAIPPDLGDMGLDAAARQAHVAWDIGAATITRILAQRFNCPAILAGTSRLVIDCNRAPGDPSSIPALTGAIAVPGNVEIAAAEVERRQNQWFWPYHREISAVLTNMQQSGPIPAVVAVHSFTPCLCGQARPWHVGVLWNRDDRMARPILEDLALRPHCCVGDNQPYCAREINYTLDTHAGAVGLPHVSFEIRQDLIADHAGCRVWADILAETLAPVLARPDLRRKQIY